MDSSKPPPGLLKTLLVPLTRSCHCGLHGPGLRANQCRADLEPSSSPCECGNREGPTSEHMARVEGEAPSLFWSTSNLVS